MDIDDKTGLETELIEGLNEEIISTIKNGTVTALHGFKPKPEKKRGASYAHIAAKYGDVSLPCLISLIQEFGFSLDEECTGHGTCLHLACEGSNLNTIEYILSTPSGKNNINRQVFSYTSITPLGLAAKRDDLPTFKLLVQHGADVGMCDGTQRTILDYAVKACQSSTGSVLEYLIIQSSSSSMSDKTFCEIVKLNNSKWLECAISVTNSRYIQSVYSGQTPLLMAVYNGCENSVKTLLSYGAWNPDHKRLGKNAYELSIDRNLTEISKLFQNHTRESSHIRC